MEVLKKVVVSILVDVVLEVEEVVLVDVTVVELPSAAVVVESSETAHALPLEAEYRPGPAGVPC